MTRVEELERELADAQFKSDGTSLDISSRLIEALKEELRICRGMRQVAKAERDMLSTRLRLCELDRDANRDALHIATGSGDTSAKIEQLTSRIATVEAERDDLAAKLREVEAQRDEWARQCNLASEAQADALSRERELAAELNEMRERAESAELGCAIAYRREPTEAEGDAHDADGDGECFVAMGGWTGRRCRGCQRWVWGGPTACQPCAELQKARTPTGGNQAPSVRDATEPHPSTEDEQ